MAALKLRHPAWHVIILVLDALVREHEHELRAAWDKHFSQ